MLSTVLANTGLVWLLAAAILAGAELAAPGVFLIFLAAAAAITGLATLALPALPITAQLASFTVWSAIAVAIGQRWYRAYPIDSADPLLNDRGARLIGEIVTVTEAITDGEGRVRVGDGEWNASGTDAQPGARLRVTALHNGKLIVVPTDQS
ncbi:MAG: NfeD family protein [Sphingomonas sp.]|jgi:hypothetical protein